MKQLKEEASSGTAILFLDCLTYLYTTQPTARNFEGLAQITGRKVLAEVLNSLSLCTEVEDYSSSCINYDPKSQNLNFTSIDFSV